MATFHNSYAEADLWVTTELVNTSSTQVTVAVKLNVSLDDADEFCIVDHVHTSQDIVIEGNSTMPYSLPPVIFFIEWSCLLFSMALAKLATLGFTSLSTDVLLLWLV